MILHTVNKSADHSPAIANAQRFMSEGDVLLLLEDGVYNAIRPVNQDCRIVVLEADVRARGLEDRLVPGIETIDYRGFVRLCTEADKVQAWP